jgi:hypothetical protein
VLLKHSCILQIVKHQIQLLQSIYGQDTVPPPQKDTGMGSNIYFVISTKQLKWGYFYSGSNLQLIRYIDAYYLSDPYKKRSQTNYLFTYVGTIISWRSVKQILVATSSNH